MERKLPLRMLLGRALRLRCVACGVGRPFTGLFGMREGCEHCGYRFEREPGYFMGSIYLNYGTTAVFLVAGIFLLDDFLGFSLAAAMVVLGLFAGLFPLWFFRRARNLWVALDHWISPPVAEDFPPFPPEPEEKTMPAPPAPPAPPPRR